MERSQILELMTKLQLYGMKAAFDEIMAAALRRHYEPAGIIGDLVKAEIAEKTARSIKYPVAKLPLAKELADFEFEGTMNHWCASLQEVLSLLSSAMWCSSAGPAPGKVI